jgi:hypothetical protein
MRGFGTFRVWSFALALAVGCAEAPEPEAPAYKTIAEVADLMEGILEPAMPRLLEIGGTLSTPRGVEKILPADDEEWMVLKHRAMAVAEVGNLLLLEPRARDAEWSNFAQSLTRSAVEMADALEARDPAMTFDAGGRLYDTCTGCHTKYLAP